MLFDPSNLLLTLITLLTLGLKVWALVDAIIRPKPAFALNGKLTKPVWIAILAVAVVTVPFGALGLFGIAGIIAAIVYLVDVRPAVRGTGGSWG